MRLIIPLEINDARLTTSNIVEDDETEWVAGTYATGVRRMVATGTPDIHKVYEVIASPDTDTNPTTDQEAAPVGSGGANWLEIGSTNRWRMFREKANEKTLSSDAVNVASITNAGLGYSSDGQFTATQASTSGTGTGAEFTVTIAGGVVTSIDAVLSGGSGYAKTDTITIDIASLTETTPAVFTVDGLGIIVVVTPATRVNSLALLQLIANSVQIVVTSVIGGGEVYNETFDLSSSEGIGNSYYNWFFNELEKRGSLVVFDIPNYLDNIITVTIVDGTECGIFVVGTQKEIGESQWGLNSNLRDFSVKETDQFGNVDIVPRGFADIIEATVAMPTNRYDPVKRLLTDVRSTLVVWAASPDFDATLTYGFYNNFDLILAGPTLCTCALDIEGIVQ